MFRGYRRPDGRVGCRNLLAVVSLLDLANDVALRIATAVPGSVAVLTGAGDLSIDPEAARLGRLRQRLCANPNVGAVLAIGPNAAPLERLATQAADAGRLAETIALAAERDSHSAVERGVGLARQLTAILASQPRANAGWDAVRLGLRSSSSSLDSARTVNPALGGLVDHILAAGGAVGFGEVADLAGVPDRLAARGATAAVGAALRAATAEPWRTLQALPGKAPDPTPSNRAGGIGSLETKGEGALRRLGTRPIAGVFDFGEALPETGLHLMAGPGSAAVCLAGLTAAGCTLVAYTVGIISTTAPSPFTPVIKVGPAALLRSRDLDLAASDDTPATVDRLIALVEATLAGAPTADERSASRQLTLPGLLPPL